MSKSKPSNVVKFDEKAVLSYLIPKPADQVPWWEQETKYVIRMRPRNASKLHLQSKSPRNKPDITKNKTSGSEA